MKLNIQIYSFLYSFLFGIGFYFLLDIFNKLIVKLNIVLRIILSFLFIMILASLYFLGLLYINNGVLHIYFLLSILVGYIFVYKVIIPLFTHLRKK